MEALVGKPPTAAAHVFKCKTCSRQFSSFQALGGHTASHGKPKLLNDFHVSILSPNSKPRTHICSICGHIFSLGQALGGHMRRHRHQGVNKKDDDDDDHHHHGEKKGRGGGCDLDLNMTPAVAMENDSEVGLLTFTLGFPSQAT